ncbi:hypothetical protein KJ359_003243 [Pestalotiopsis sp. 9143b]|nr:hypothetical protein KJ359_003243 [Pestalotiopsis sp. 9143b]
MPSFGRIGRLSNRSQHNLVEQQQQQQQQQQANALPSLLTSSSSGFGVGAGPGSASSASASASASANTPPSASSTALSSSEPFPGDTRAPLTTAQQQAQSKHQYQQSQQLQQQLLLQEEQLQIQHLQQLQQFQQQQFQPQQAQQQQQLPHRLQEQHPNSIVQGQQQQQQAPPPPPKNQQQQQQSNHYATTAAPTNYPSSGAPTPNHNPTSSISNPVLDSPVTATTGAYANLRQQQQQQFQQQQSTKSHNSDFAESVSRSQSTRYPQSSPAHNQQFFGPASSSVDNLPGTVSSPLIPPSPPGLPAGPYGHHQQHHQGQVTPTESKQSTRKLIKKILQGASASKAAASYSSSDSRHHQSQSGSYDNTSGTTRRPSKRASNAYPPNLRASVSLEQQQIPDWQKPPQQQSSAQISPLRQDVRSFPDHYSRESPLPNTELRLQNPQSQGPQPTSQPHPHSSSIRQVPASADYSPENLAFQQQQQAQAIAQAQLQAQTSQQQQQQRYTQAADDSAQSQEQYRQYAHSRVQSQSQVQQGTPPRLYTSHLASQQSNPETISQISYDSPITDSDQRSQNFQSSQTSPAVNYPQQERSAPLSQQPASPSPTVAQPSPMAPPSGGPSSRRSGENDKLRGSSIEPPQGPPPNYRHSQTLNTMSSLPPTPGPGQPNRGEFRASNAPDRQVQQQQFDGSNEAGRDSPQPATGTESLADSEKQFKDLLTKYKNVKRLYFDGKSQIELLTSQVEQLQNAVANQRISQSRTALDDSEYATRFNRLNGAINNLAFNIRKDWASLPSWLSGFVSPEAIKTGKQEMTAVGRAVITRWIVDEVFHKCFHPGLDQELSSHLKEIEHNIRRFSYTLNSQEEFDALTSKVVSWRMATLEGLQHRLQSPESQDSRTAYTKSCNEELNEYILHHLADPKPAGVEGSVTMIIELAVGIAANLSLESRDVAVTYPLPGDQIQPDFMELEKAGLPPLPDSDDAEEISPDGDKSKKDKSKSAAPTYPAKDSAKVRFAGFVAVEVRGRQVLVKAPVWNLS